MSALTSLVIGLVAGVLVGLTVPFLRDPTSAERRLDDANALIESQESQLKERSRQIAEQAGQLLRVRTELAALRAKGDVMDALGAAR